jgi:hypothetical protein
MVHRALVDASALAASIGRRNDSKMLTQEAQRLQADFNDLLWNEHEGAYDGALFGPGSELRSQLGHPFPGGIVDGRFRPTAQANLFALYSGIVPAERIGAVRKWVLAHLEEVREPMSHYYLFQILYSMGDKQQDEAVLTLMRTGWKNQVDSEWQTTWEELENGGGSKIHIYGMHPGYFLTAFVLGARREGPVDRRTILIEPRFSGLDWAKGVCVTEFGPVEMEWKCDGAHGTQIGCTVPRGARATLRLRLEDARNILEIDGRFARARRANDWIEASLPPGKHTIRFSA